MKEVCHRDGLSRGRSVKREVFHQGGLMRVICHGGDLSWGGGGGAVMGVVCQEGGLLWGWSVMRVVCHAGVLS